MEIMETEVENKSNQLTSAIIENPDTVFISDSITDSTEIPDDKLEKESELAGVLCKGVQYYDFKNIPFIGNTGLASLIRILKSSLKQGIKLKFVNVNKRIKQKIKTMGLDKFINCS
jgi:ABC-type transporter Mla MlaB component